MGQTGLRLGAVVGQDEEQGDRQADSNPQPPGDVERALEEVRARRRTRHLTGRQRAVKVLYDDAEYALVRAAAALMGLTPTGFLAGAGVAAASPATGTGPTGPPGAVERALLGELLAARTQLRRVGTNLNQALVVLHSNGAAPGWLAVAVDRCHRAVQRVDEVTLPLAQRLDRTHQHPARTSAKA